MMKKLSIILILFPLIVSGQTKLIRNTVEVWDSLIIGDTCNVIGLPGSEINDTLIDMDDPGSGNYYKVDISRFSPPYTDYLANDTSGNVYIGQTHKPESWIVYGDSTVNGSYSLSVNPETGLTLILNDSTVLQIDTSYNLNIHNRFIRFNDDYGVYEFETGIADVVWQGSQEDLTPYVFNNTGSIIMNGTPVSFTGTQGDSIATIAPTIITNDSSSNRFIGVATHDIGINEVGFVNQRGYVRDLNTSAFDNNIIYVGDGELIDSTPPHPNRVIVAGVLIDNDATDGIVYSNPSFAFQRSIITRGYPFTSQGIGSGTFYTAGFYDFNSTSTTLTQASTTQAYGNANEGHCSHASIVAGGAGTATGGVVGLRVTGTSITDDGTLTTSDADTIITDITLVSLNDYYEAKKFVGIVTFELITISGTPTTYSFTFNYGLAKYDDFSNQDFYVDNFEVVGLAGATDASFNIELLYHRSTGWTYAASSFIPGNGSIASFDELSPYDNLVNGEHFALKRTELYDFIEGTANEGVIIRITTSANNTVQSLVSHVTVAVDN